MLPDVTLHYKKTNMATNKTIAIIGATGNMGSAIAKSLSKFTIPNFIVRQRTKQNFLTY